MIELNYEALAAATVANDNDAHVDEIIIAYLEALPTRQELQAKGIHPAPCGRLCEATAFEIEIRGLKAQLAKALTK